MNIHRYKTKKGTAYSGEEGRYFYTLELEPNRKGSAETIEIDISQEKYDRFVNYYGCNRQEFLRNIWCVSEDALVEKKEKQEALRTKELANNLRLELFGNS